jgi:Ca-activated chloride channel family protein
MAEPQASPVTIPPDTTTATGAPSGGSIGGGGGQGQGAANMPDPGYAQAERRVENARSAGIIGQLAPVEQNEGQQRYGIRGPDDDATGTATMEELQDSALAGTGRITIDGESGGLALRGGGWDEDNRANAPSGGRDRGEGDAVDVLAQLEDRASGASPFGTEAAFGDDPTSALGALMGEGIGESFGFSGLNADAVAQGRHRITIQTSIVLGTHRPRRCSDAAGLLIDDRRALWRERLGNAAGPSGWAEVYAQAIRNCEAPTWRDRRALLEILLAHAGNVPRMLQLYSVLSDSSARAFLRAAILRRVRSPEDLRAVREAFRLTQDVDWELVQTVIDRAPTPAARVRALRQLVADMPFSFDLKLRLLEELERQDRLPEAKRLADRLRADPLADPGVRTAVGEMYLRAGEEDEARRVFSEIVEFAPLDELARRRLGDLYRAHGWFEEAYRQYLTLAEIRPDDPSVLLFVAQAAAGAGRIDEALRLEQRVAETAPPGSVDGLARTALLWSSVRFAKLRQAAREARDQDRLSALLARMRRSGVLGQASQLRVSLVWSHPDARISLWASHPGLGLSRPTDISPELGIEAFDVAEAETGEYRIEVRRPPPESGFHTTPIEAELVIVWNEGQEDEKVEVVPVRFAPATGPTGQGDLAFAWTITGRDLRQARSEGWGGAR